MTLDPPSNKRKAETKPPLAKEVKEEEDNGQFYSASDLEAMLGLEPSG